ncbi:MAG TPA: hypothetical protein VFU40_08470 [Gemmatimonadales bacterium]|nr:hypothetical protein [Gemmatimonadales bacterium]
MRSAWVCLFVIWLIGLSCETGPSGIDIRLSVVTSTRGINRPDGYTLFIDGTGHPIPASGWFHHQVDGWDHTVLLGDVPPNCKVISPNPTSTGITSGGVYWSDKIIEFEVYCDWNALFRATVRTGGANYESAQHWRLDKGWLDVGLYWSADVPVNGSRDFGPWLAGEETVRLGVAANCQVDGENPRSVVLIHEQLVESIFEVTCS